MSGPRSDHLRNQLQQVANSESADLEALLPTRLAAGCASVLSADGAGISLMLDAFRVPAGASSEEASWAERMQFTLGEGPCLAGALTQEFVVADAATLRARWPLYAGQIEDGSPYRAILTIPLRLTAALQGAVDVFFVDPSEMATLRLVDVLAVQEEVTLALTHTAFADEEPDAVASRFAGDRLQVWIAVGMLI